MYASDVAQRHFSAAVNEAETAGLGHEAVCRALLGLVISKYLETRSVADIQAATALHRRELRSRHGLHVHASVTEPGLGGLIRRAVLLPYALFLCRIRSAKRLNR
ncbi:hypothetical protein [Bradyrhizobium liaoningense]